MIRELIASMTFEEKLAQLSAYMFFDSYWNTHGTKDEQDRIDFVLSVEPAEMIPEAGLGFSSTQLRDLPPRTAAEVANRNQHYIQEHTRLKIPMIIHDEGLHGLLAHSATSFPSALGMAASWNPDLMEAVAHAIGYEARARGIRQLLSPTINLGIDPRCGRTEETYGEDPYLASRMGVAYIRGVQAERVICTPKHFVANFSGDGGRDSFAIHHSERRLREVFFPPFEAAIKEAGALSLMAAYNSCDGVPCAGNHWLLTRVLRDEWGFEGYVVADYHAVIHQWELHGTASTMGDAARQSLEAGLDVELPRVRCFDEPLRELVASGKVSMEAFDRAVERVLTVKEKIGLFDQYISDPDEAERVTNCTAHRELAREMARQSLVLLRNEKGRLPFATNVEKVAVIGPNADAVELGDYSWDLYTKEHVVTVLEGIRRLLPDADVEYLQGCEITGENRAGFASAVALAEKSDVVVAVVGASLKLFGEARDRTTLNLPGVQEELILALQNTGKPLVVVVLSGSVHTMANWNEKVDALLYAWYAGEEGGTAIAETIFGVNNPCGKLPITIPRTIGQCPVTYYQKPSGRGHTYTNLGQDGGVLYPFGHGLSYTTFAFKDLQIAPNSLHAGEFLTVACTVENSGRIPGTEVVQLYIRDPLASVARPLKELKRFARISLKPGERKAVEFQLAHEDFAFLNKAMVKEVEPGEIQIMIGASCEDIRLTGSFELR